MTLIMSVLSLSINKFMLVMTECMLPQLNYLIFGEMKQMIFYDKKLNKLCIYQVNALIYVLRRHFILIPFLSHILHG